MANVNKEPNLVRAYIDKRDEMRAPCYHIDPKTGEKVECTGKLTCPVCAEIKHHVG